MAVPQSTIRAHDRHQVLSAGIRHNSVLVGACLVISCAWGCGDNREENLEALERRARLQMAADPKASAVNLTHLRVELEGGKKNTPIHLPAVELLDDFSKAPVAAYQKYHDKWLVVAGVILRCETSITGELSVLLEARSEPEFRHVQCGFSGDSDPRSIEQVARPGMGARILGQCTGRLGNVRMQKCELVELTASPLGRNRPREQDLPAEGKEAEGKPPSAPTEIERIRKLREEAALETELSLAKEFEKQGQQEKAKILAAQGDQADTSKADIKLAFAKRHFQTIIDNYSKTKAAEEARKILKEMK